MDLAELVLFMNAYCGTRFLFKDYMCEKFRQYGCFKVRPTDILRDYWQWVLIPTYSKLIKTKIENIQKTWFRDFPEKCAQTAFETFTLEYIARSCTIQRGTYMSEFAMGNRADDAGFSWWYHPVNISIVAIIWLMIQGWAIYCHYKAHEYQVLKVQQADYSVKLKNLPQVQGGVEEDPNFIVEEELKEIFRLKNMKVTHVSMLYDSEEYLDAQQELCDERTRVAKLVYRKREGLEYLPGRFRRCFEALTCSKKRTGHFTAVDKADYDELHTDVDRLKKKFKGSLCKEFQGVAIVSFQSVAMRNFAMEYWGKKTNCLGCQIAGDFAPLTITYKSKPYELKCYPVEEPTDLIFENQVYQGKARWWRASIAYIVIAMIFFGGNALIFCIYMLGQNLRSYNRKNAIKHAMGSWGWIINFARNKFVALSIVGFNFVISAAVTAMTKFRKYNDRTTEQLDIAQFSYRLQFLNSGIIPLLSACFAMNYFGSGGLLAEINGIFFFAMIIKNLLAFFDPWWFYRKRKIHKFETAWTSKDKDSLADYTQREAHTLYNRPDFPIMTNIADGFLYMSLSSFYLTMLPFGVLYTAIATGLGYAVMKWILFYRSGKGMEFGRIVGTKSIVEFEFCLFLMAAGIGTKEIILELINLKPFWISPTTTLLIGLTFFNWILDAEDLQLWMAKRVTGIVRTCCSSGMVDMEVDSESANPTYDVAEKQWSRTYGTENPVTKAQEIRERNAAREI